MLVFVGLAACGGRIATESDAGTTDGGTCNTLDLLGDTITVIDVGAASALNTKGSPPPEGTYVLMGSGRFNGDTAGTHGTLSLTVQVTPDSWQVARSDDGGPVERRTYGIHPANPTGYRLSGVCGATESVLVWFLPINGLGFAFAIHDDASSIDWVFQFNRVEK